MIELIVAGLCLVGVVIASAFAESYLEGRVRNERKEKEFWRDIYLDRLQEKGEAVIHQGDGYELCLFTEEDYEGTLHVMVAEVIEPPVSAQEAEIGEQAGETEDQAPGRADPDVIGSARPDAVGAAC